MKNYDVLTFQITINRFGKFLRLEESYGDFLNYTCNLEHV